MAGNSDFGASISIRYKPSKLSLNCDLTSCPAAREIGVFTGTKFRVFFHQLHQPKIPMLKIIRAIPDFVASLIVIRSPHASPLRESMKRVHIIVDYVGVRVFLPAAEAGIFEEVARAALVINGIQREIQRLSRFAGESF
jgi:hypothetical protein